MKRIVTLEEESDYYCGEYINGRYYTGVYGGETYKKDGRYIMVDGEWIKWTNGSVRFNDKE